MNLLTRACALALLLALISLSPVAAADEVSVYQKLATSSNPAATWAGLTRAQQDAYRLFQTPARATFTVSTTRPTATAVRASALLPTICWKVGYVWQMNNNVGWRIWSWNLIVRWCGDGFTVSEQSSRAYGETYIAFWSWQQVSSTLDVYRVPNPDQIEAFAQAEFKSCIFSNIGCVSYVYPWIDLQGDALGHHRWITGG